MTENKKGTEMKEKTCGSCKWCMYDNSSKRWWCCNDLSEDFEKIVSREMTEACEEHEEGK